MRIRVILCGIFNYIEIMNCLLKVRFSTFLWAFGCFIITLVIIQVLLEKYNMMEFTDMELSEKSKELRLLKYKGIISDLTDPIVLWWTPFTGELGASKDCGHRKCFFTENRIFRGHPLVKVMMFYGSKFDLMDLPLPRNGTFVNWALLHEESPKNTPVLSHEAALGLFNYTATFSRKSSFPLTLQYLKDTHVLTDTKYFVPVKIKNELLTKLSPVVYVHSDCNTPLERDAYVIELMKYIPVDSYGACVQNKELPPQLADPIEGMEADEFLHFVAPYKFTLTFENSVCEDYITEKLWRPLIVGSVPVYMGSPSVKDWLPNKDSAILAADFQSPRELAKYLLKINKNDSLYETFLQHKLSLNNIKITNINLISTLDSRLWGINNDYEKGNMVEHFECFVCNKVHELSNHEHSERWSYIANTDHYNCPPPLSPLTGKENNKNWWLDQWQTSKCEAKVLRHFVDIGKDNYTHSEFYDEVMRQMLKHSC